MARMFSRKARSVYRGLYTSRCVSFSEEELYRLRTLLKGSRATLISPSASNKDAAETSLAVASRRALAVLTGWTSAPLKAVVKHAAPYTKVGIPAVCVAPSVLQVWNTGLGSSLTRSLLESLDATLQEPVSLVLHFFSGAAGVTLPLIVSDFESSERELTRKLNPACTVFDSGPTEFSYTAGMAAARLMRDQGGYNYPTYLAAIITGITVNALIGKHKRLELGKVLRSPLLDTPQLYLHSETDTVTPPSRVRKVMLDQQAIGREVSSYCWKDSQHVRHYLGDPDTYEHYIHALLKKCQLF